MLTYPEVNQNLVGPSHRKPSLEDMGFLCMASGSSAAALNGLVRYTVSGTVCRCYNMVGHDCISNLLHYLGNMDCLCTNIKEVCTYSIAGTSFTVCTSCGQLLKSKIYELSSVSPHCLTIHANSICANS